MRAEFQKISKWDRELNEVANKFYKKFAVYPNIMLAGKKTYKAIENKALKKPKNIRRVSDGLPATEAAEIDGPIELSCFSTDDYNLEFYIVKHMGYGRIKLVHDDMSELNGEKE